MMNRSLRAALHLLSPGSSPRRGLFLALSGAVLAIAALFGVVLMDARSDARRAADVSGSNLATALAQDIDRNVELLDLSVQAARDAWSDPRVRGLNPELRQLVVFDHSATARHIDAILVIDRDGSVVADSRSVVPRTRDFRSADFFRAQAERDVGLFISRPMKIARSSAGGWCMALSRRITAADGTFAGVAVGFIDLGYIAETYKRLPLGRGGTLSLFNIDGTMLVREPEIPDAIGQSFLGKPTFDRLTVGSEGTFDGQSALDGQSRLYAYRRVGTLPLIQAVAAGTDAIYANWRAKALTLGAALAMLCSGILVLLFVLKHELSQRAAAEAALDLLASTDHLTGLLNRRKFFELAEARCADAARRGVGVALLMIDADHFKSYNDCYGHVAGDSVLAAIGRCIAGELRSVDDLAARFGGEEFIVLLPGLERAGAFVIAEAMRAGVARLATPHERASAGIVTVSTGLAVLEPGAPIVLDALVEAADAELYRSKRDGRNRSSGGERLAARVPLDGPPGLLSA